MLLRFQSSDCSDKIYRSFDGFQRAPMPAFDAGTLVLLRLRHLTTVLGISKGRISALWLKESRSGLNETVLLTRFFSELPNPNTRAWHSTRVLAFIAGSNFRIRHESSFFDKK